MLGLRHRPHLPDCARSLPDSIAPDSNLHALTELRLRARELLHARGAAGDGLHALLPGTWLAQSRTPRVPAPALYRPALGAVLQGAKQVLVGTTVLEYRAGEALLTQVPVPARGMVTVGDRQQPFLGLVVELDPALLRQVCSELDMPAAAPPAPAPFSVVALQPALIDCLQRLLALAADDLQAQQFLWPALQRELAFRLLQSPAGPAVAAMAQPAPAARRLATAIRTLQHGFRQPLDASALASRAGMSTALFYRRFRDATGLSPLQYQKRLRLLEARRLLQQGGTSITATAFAVGYESPSQFSREFSRLFGHPPRDSLPQPQR